MIIHESFVPGKETKLLVLVWWAATILTMSKAEPVRPYQRIISNHFNFYDNWLLNFNSDESISHGAYAFLRDRVTAITLLSTSRVE